MADLTEEETTLLVAALDDDLSLVWVMIYLGIRANPPASPRWVPSTGDLDAAFESLAKLLGLGLVEVGRIEQAMDPDGVGSVQHHAEDLATVRGRVDKAIATASQESNWENACWVVSTAAGDTLARLLV